MYLLKYSGFHQSYVFKSDIANVYMYCTTQLNHKILNRYSRGRKYCLQTSNNLLYQSNLFIVSACNLQWNNQKCFMHQSSSPKYQPDFAVRRLGQGEKFYNDFWKKQSVFGFKQMYQPEHTKCQLFLLISHQQISNGYSHLI